MAGLLTWLFTRTLRAAPWRGLPEEARRFYERLQGVLAERHPEVELIGPTVEGFGAVLRVERQELVVPLGEVFLRERAFPAAFDRTVDRLVGELHDHLATTHDLPFDEAVSRLLPQIRTEQWVRESSPAFGPGRLVTTPVFDDLVTCYVLDEPESMVFVTHGHLEAWGSRAEHIENLALTNLRRRAASEGGLTLPESADQEPTVVHTGDGYDAARALLLTDPERLEATRGLVFAVPDRDTLVIGRKESLASLMADVATEFASAPHPISPRVYDLAGAP